jgi:hypothetical protein
MAGGGLAANLAIADQQVAQQPTLKHVRNFHMYVIFTPPGENNILGLSLAGHVSFLGCPLKERAP